MKGFSLHLWWDNNCVQYRKLFSNVKDRNRSRNKERKNAKKSERNEKKKREVRKFKEKDKKEGRKRKVGQKEKEINIKLVKKARKLESNG